MAHSAAMDMFTDNDDNDNDGLPWKANELDAIRSRRPDGQLLFDRLLELAGVDASLYPPEDYAGLRRLLSHIYDGEHFDALKKDCLVYYLLHEYGDSRHAAFARKKRIPKAFVKAIDGYWSLDHDECEEGLKQLVAPGVEPNFVCAILAQISTLPDRKERASLIANFVTFADISSPLNYNDSLLVADALLDASNVTEAMVWYRRLAAENSAQDETSIVRQTMARLCERCFTSSPPLENALHKLLSFPFTPIEESAILEWAETAVKPTSSYSSKIAPRVNEWCTSRMVALGRYVEAIALLSSSLPTLRSLGDAHRKATDSIASLTLALPPVLRSALDVSLAAPTSNGPDSASYAAVARKDATTKDKEAVSGAIAQVSWLPKPAGLSVRPASTLAQAQADDAARAEAVAGGPPLSRALHLPLSASGLLRADKGRAVASQGAKRDARMDVLNALRKGSTNDTAGNPRKSSLIAEGLNGARRSGSPFTAASPSSVRVLPPTARINSPFSVALPSSSTKSTMQQGTGTTTVRGFGGGARHLPTPTRLDFTEQLRKHASNRQTALAYRDDVPKLTPAPSGSARKAGRAKVADQRAENEEGNDARQAQPDERGHEPSRSHQRSLPPGAFLHSDEESDDDQAQERQQNNDNNEMAEEGGPARSTREGARQQSSIPPNQDRGSKKGGSRTSSQREPPPPPAPTPSKKGRKAKVDGSREASRPAASKSRSSNMLTTSTPAKATRRSTRLASVALDEEDENEDDDEDESMVEDSMIGRGGRTVAQTQTLRRRRA